MELGVAISGYKEVIESAYDLPIISREADFLSAMTYDYHGGWERATAHHTPLVPSPKDTLAYYSIVSKNKLSTYLGTYINHMHLFRREFD